MHVNLSDSFISNTLSNAIGTLIAALISAFFAYLIFPSAKRWIYNHNPQLGEVLQRITVILFHPFLRLFLFLFSTIYIYLNLKYKEIFVVVSILTFLSFFSKRKIYKLSSQSSIFTDNFESSSNRIRTRNWDIKTGSPKITSDNGHSKLNLTMSTPPEATNSFVIAKDLELERGTIECDIWIAEGGLFNIVFFADIDTDNWHMARYEARSSESDAFLIKDGGQGNNWRFNKILGVRTFPNQWHHVKVEFSAEKARMYKDGDFIGEITNPPILGKRVGFFNECNDVLVGNFSISKNAGN